MNVSNLIALLSRVVISLFVLPLFVLAVCAMTYACTLMFSTAVLLGTPHALTMLGTEVKLVQSFFVATPGLWVGLLIAAAAAHQSNRREKSS
jgi:hypothetical protein